jgi:SAM-dependent methyltransferase
LLAAEAHALPFVGGRFGLIAMVHALHHFGEPARYLERVTTLLQPGGAVVVVGLDPASGRDRWYLYDYFPETLPLDRERYPAHASIRRWLRELGFERVTTRTAARIQATQTGLEVLDDPILHRYGTSQLTLLDQDAFDRGMTRVREAAERDRACAFVTDLELPMTRGFRPR